MLHLVVLQAVERASQVAGGVELSQDRKAVSPVVATRRRPELARCFDEELVSALNAVGLADELEPVVPFLHVSYRSPDVESVFDEESLDREAAVTPALADEEAVAEVPTPLEPHKSARFGLYERSLHDALEVSQLTVLFTDDLDYEPLLFGPQLFQ